MLGSEVTSLQPRVSCLSQAYWGLGERSLGVDINHLINSSGGCQKPPETTKHGSSFCLSPGRKRLDTGGVIVNTYCVCVWGGVVVVGMSLERSLNDVPNCEKLLLLATRVEEAGEHGQG